MRENYSLDDLLDGFESYVITEKANAELTAKLYRADMNRVLPERVHKKLLKEAEIKTDKDYYNVLVKKIDERVRSIDEWDKPKQSTKNRRICTVNSFLEYLENRGKIEKAMYYKTKTIERTPLTTITETEFTGLMHVIPSDKYVNARDRAIFSLMFFNGIRSSEAANIAHENFRIEDGKFYITVGKGEQKRRLEIDKRATEELKSYANLYNAAWLSKGHPLKSGTYFKNKHGEKISTRSIRRKLEQWAKKAGLNAEPNHLRYSYAQRQLNKRVMPEELAGLMGMLPYSAHLIDKLLPSC